MSNPQLVFVGTYTEPILFGTGKVLYGKGEGIYAFTVNGASAALQLNALTKEVPNPSYLAFDSTRQFLYAVNELKEYEGATSGAVSAFAVDLTDGSLKFLNRKASHGTDPCHLTVDKDGKNVLVANFMSGSVCVLPIQADGSLADASQVIQHEGSSVDPARQAGPHAHAVTLDDSGRFAFVPDLGLDKLMIYKFDAQNGKLEPNIQPWIKTAPGAGPRQVVMHPGGAYAYLINELNSTMTAYRFDGEQGTLEEIHTVSTLPDDFDGASTCAEVQIHPTGRFLYGSNRGHDSIVSYAIDPADGTLTCTGHTSAQGKTPRNFVVSPDGKMLLVANQDTDNIVSYRIDPASGRPQPTGEITTVPTPVCVRFV